MAGGSAIMNFSTEWVEKTATDVTCFSRFIKLPSVYLVPETKKNKYENYTYQVAQSADF